jgi:hypothetical protein
VFAHFTVTYFQEKEVHSLTATCNTMCARLGCCLNTRPSLSLSMRMCLTFLVILLCRPICLQRMTRRSTLSLEDRGYFSTDFMTFISHELPMLATFTDELDEAIKDIKFIVDSLPDEPRLPRAISHCNTGLIRSLAGSHRIAERRDSHRLRHEHRRRQGC